jgi:hypothetical protein
MTELVRNACSDTVLHVFPAVEVPFPKKGATADSTTIDGAIERIRNMDSVRPADLSFIPQLQRACQNHFFHKSPEGVGRLLAKVGRYFSAADYNSMNEAIYANVRKMQEKHCLPACGEIERPQTPKKPTTAQFNARGERIRYHEYHDEL